MLLRIAKGPATRPTDLVDLLMECHERIRRFSALARHIGEHPESVDEECIEACMRVERYFTEALPLHVADEEESILPRLRGRSDDVDQALATMAAQHRAHEPLLEALLAALIRVREQPSDTDRRAALSEVARSLDAELLEHLELEEAVILPAIHRHLSAEVRAQLVDELRSRRAEKPPTPPTPPP